MKKGGVKYIKILVWSVLIAILGVFIVDYFSHLLFSDPMETTGYFLGKATLYIVYSIIFLSVVDLKKNELLKVIIGGVIVASIWGFYYNVLPLFTGGYSYDGFKYRVGIPLAGLTFLGMGLFGTGLAFGIVHTLAFIFGYYSGKWILDKFKAFKK